MKGRKGNAEARTRTLFDEEGSPYNYLQDAPRPKQTYGQGRFHIVFEGPLRQRLWGVKGLPPTAKAFIVLPDYLTFTEFRLLRQEDLAIQLGVTQGTVSRSLRELHQLGIIDRKGSGPHTQWRLSMDWGWRGNTESYHKARREQGEKPHPKLTVVRPEPPAAA